MIYGVLPYDSLSAKERFREISEKKIFASKEPPTYKGVTPSQAAYDFMRFLIVVDSKLRPNWKQVSEHPLIRNIDDEFISQRFLKQCDVNADSDLNYEETITENNSAVIQPEPEVTQEFKGFLQKVSGIADSKKPHSQHYPEELSPNRLNSQKSSLLPKDKTPK